MFPTYFEKFYFSNSIMATMLDLTFLGVVVALLAVIAGWFMSQKEPEKIEAPPSKDVSEPEAKTVKPSKAGLPAKKTQIKVGAHPNMLCAFKGHTGEDSIPRFHEGSQSRSTAPKIACSFLTTEAWVQEGS